MEKREEHCAFAKLNCDGKCIAACFRNVYDEDCIGIKHVPWRPVPDHPDWEKRKV